jgi:hypothetical protein
MAVFGKRPASPDTSSTPQQPVGSGKPLIVKASAVDAAKTGRDAYQLVQAVVDFVNFALHEAFHVRGEIEVKALQAYHADYYLAQVNNGGHSQFVHNTNGIRELINGDALAALTAMQAPHSDILNKMISWIVANPDEAQAQNGFEVRAPFLDELDQEFYARDKTDPMIERSSRWILTWPELQAVPDDQYKDHLTRLAQANPRSANRKVSQQISQLTKQTLDTFYVGIGLTLGVAQQAEVLLGIGGGAVEKINGKDEMAFYIKTSRGERKAVLDDDGCRIYTDHDELLSHVKAETIAATIRVAQKSNAGPAIALMMAKLGLAGQPLSFTVVPPYVLANSSDAIRWQVATCAFPVMIETTNQGATMLVFDEEQQRFTSSKAEIDTFVADYT